MKGKLFLAIIILILLSTAILFGLDYFGIYTFEQVKSQALEELNSIPVVEEYLITKEETEKLQADLAAARARVNQLQNKNQELSRKLQLKNKQIEEQEATISQLRDELEKVRINKETYQNKVKRLAKIYNEMDSEGSAELLPKLEMKLIIDVLNEMDQEVVAEILNEMPTEDAVRISGELSN